MITPSFLRPVTFPPAVVLAVSIVVVVVVAIPAVTAMALRATGSTRPRRAVNDAVKPGELVHVRGGGLSSSSRPLEKSSCRSRWMSTRDGAPV